MSSTPPPLRWTRARRLAAAIEAAAALLAVVALLAFTHPASVSAAPSPLALAASAADALRVRVGPSRVAWAEGAGTAVLDLWAQLRYRAGARPATPWSVPAPAAPAAPADRATPAEPPAPQGPVPVAPPASAARSFSVVPGRPAAPPAAPPAHSATPAPASVAPGPAAPAPARPTPPGAASPLSQPQQPAAAAPGSSAGAVPAPPSTSRQVPVPLPTPAPTPPPLGSQPIQPLADLPPLPGEGLWTAAGLPGQTDASGPVLLKSFIRPDPARPYAQVALLKVDAHRTRLHLVAGTAEPGGAAQPGPGVIPPSDAVPGTLLAAFNGGFKAINGHFGMQVGSTVFQPLQDGLATLALYPDGRVALGAWGTDLSATAGPAPLAIRQNGPLLLRDGQLTRQALDDAAWGQTITTSAYTWRSGLGLTAGGNLVYAVGPSLTARTLGDALRMAGAVTAMQLDINPFWVRCVTYAPDASGALAPSSLWSQLTMQQTQFLTPYTRDFFYVTAAPASPRFGQ